VIAQEIIPKIDKRDFIKLESYCITKEMITRAMRQPRE
jgi:hypothetical protein